MTFQRSTLLKAKGFRLRPRRELDLVFGLNKDLQHQENSMLLAPFGIPSNMGITERYVAAAEKVSQ